MNAILFADENERLQTLYSYGILDTAPEKAFDDIARLASQACGTPIATVSLLDSERQWFKALVGFEAVQIPRTQSFCTHAILQSAILEVPDATLDARFRDNPMVTGEPHVRFYAGAPLVSHSGYVLGTLCVAAYSPRTLSDEQREALEHLSCLAVTQLELRKIAAEHEREREAQARASRLLRERPEVLSSVLATIPHQIFWKDRNSVYLGCNSSFAQGAGLVAPENIVGKTDFDLPWTLEEAETYRRDDRHVVEAGRRMIDKEENYFHADGSVTVGLTSKLPLYDAEGRTIIGVLGVSQDISERKALEVEREHLLSELETLLAAAEARADCDPLTGLLNHRAFHKRLAEETEHAQREGLPLAIAMLDLDNFKFFNDAYGHLAGDDVLRRVAEGLRRHCRPCDTLGRFGSDEFGLLMPGLDAAGAEAMVQHVIARLDERGYTPPGHDAPVPLLLSAGLSVFPDEAPDRLEALAAAETRLRLAKTGGGQEDAHHVRTQMGRSLEGFSMLDALVTAVDNMDRYTRRHSEDVLAYSAQIADALGLDERTRRTVAVAALLHDVGKIGVPDKVLRKPGPLTGEEFLAVRSHPMMGAIIVGAVPGLEGTLDAVRHHHERWDGGGYPFGLRGEETPLLARLLAVADAFSAMTTDRPYRKGMAPSAALSILAGGAGTQWDPACVQAFLRARAHGGVS